MPREPFLSYYWRRTKEMLAYGAGLLKIVWMFRGMKREAARAENVDYIDTATMPEIHSQEKNNRKNNVTDTAAVPVTCDSFD